ncbi:MAG: DUF4382 domain-containing protein [Bacteroidota bacterium]
MNYKTCLSILALVLFSLSSCDFNMEENRAQVEVFMTDAPFDDEDVKAVFITVAEVKIDGESYPGFSGKKTIELSALQNGKTQSLGLSEVEVGSYQTLSLVLDLNTDQDDNKPGCYVLTVDNEKKNLLSNNTTSLQINSSISFDSQEGKKTELVLDMDLRKAIQYEKTNNDKDYAFVSEDQLSRTVRAVSISNSGSIEGELKLSPLVEAGKVIVYAYEKGSFDKAKETRAQGDSGLTFAGAITSTEAKVENGFLTYKLAFLEEGDYEICITSLEDDNQDGQYQFKGFLHTSLSGEVTTAVKVEAKISTNLTLDILGIIN